MENENNEIQRVHYEAVGDSSETKEILPPLEERIANFEAELAEKGLKVTDRHKIVEVDGTMYFLQPVTGLWVLGLMDKCKDRSGKSDNVKFTKTLLDNVVAYPFYGFAEFEPTNELEMAVELQHGQFANLRMPTVNEYLEISGNSTGIDGGLNIQLLIPELLKKGIITNANAINFENDHTFKDLITIIESYQKMTKESALGTLDRLTNEVTSFLGITD